ncbi:unnamed protein product, partial [Cuscuta epithymum]
MEEENTTTVASPDGKPASKGGQNGLRWNPTKEQINLLERFYNEGIRTPTAEQIQEITGMLRAFGHIEGKNVFYWFQNHKARQRQKLKHQHNLAPLFIPSTNYQLHYPLYPFPPPSPNVTYPPYYMPPPPQGGVGIYPKNTELFIPSWQTMGYNRKLPSMGMIGCGDEDVERKRGNAKPCRPETLNLFPLCPTGVLHEECNRKNVDAGFNTPTPSWSGDDDNDNERFTFFDFFCGNGCYG